MKLFKNIQWPQAVLLLGLVAAATCAAIFAPEDVRGPLVGMLTALAGWLRSPSLGT